MYFVSAGIPKSGSTLLTNLLTMLVGHTHGWRGRLAFTDWVSADVGRGSGEYLHEGWSSHGAALAGIASDEAPLVLETHSALPGDLSMLPRLNSLIFSLSDPSDVVLSAMDHAKRSVASGSDEFIRHLDFETSLEIVGEWCEKASVWLSLEEVHCVRYEDLVATPELELWRLAHELELDGSWIESILSKERSIRGVGTNRFNTGRVGRFVEEMPAEMLRRCNEYLQDHLCSLEYAWD